MPGRYRWVVLAVAAGATGALASLQMGLPALGPVLRDRFDLSLAEVGVVFTTVNLSIMATLLGWGMLADRAGDRAVLAVGLGGASIGLAGAAFTQSLVALLVALALAGLCGSSAVAASGRAVAGWFSRHERAFALGLRQTAVPLGGALAAAVLPLLAGAGGLRAALLALACAALAAAIAGAVWLREPPPSPRTRRPANAPRPFRDRRIWRLSAGSALIICAQTAMVGFVALFLFEARGWSEGAAALAMSAMLLGGALARAVAGRWSDMRAQRLRPLRMLALAAAATLVGLALLVDAPIAALLPVLLVAGTLSMSWNGLSFTAASEIAGHAQTGAAIGLQNTVMRTVGAAVPAAFGALVGATSWSVAFGVLAVFPALGFLVLAPLVGEEEQRRIERERRLRARHAERARAASGAPDPRSGARAAAGIDHLE